MPPTANQPHHHWRYVSFAFFRAWEASNSHVFIRPDVCHMHVLQRGMSSHEHAWQPFLCGGSLAAIADVALPPPPPPPPPLPLWHPLSFDCQLT